MLACDEVRKLGYEAAFELLHCFAKLGVTYDMLEQCRS